MARTTFYDDNKHRRYPFISTAAIESSPDAIHQIPDSVLLACGFTMHAYSGFIVGTHSVWLNRLSYDSGNLILEFASDAPGISGEPITFTVPRAAGESTIVFSEATGVGTNVISGGCTDQLLWMGFAVVGNTEDYVAWATANPYATVATQHTIEPGLIQSLDGSYVRSVNLANQKRVQTTDAPGAVRPYIVNAQCIQGPIRFLEGVNCRIDYDLGDNGLIFNAEVGAGAGETCVEIPVYIGEASPDGGSLLSGGPTCNETIKTINGVGGPRISMRGAPGGGIAVEKDLTNPHKINVTIIPGLLAGLP